MLISSTISLCKMQKYCSIEHQTCSENLQNFQKFYPMLMEGDQEYASGTSSKSINS